MEHYKRKEMAYKLVVKLVKEGYDDIHIHDAVFLSYFLGKETIDKFIALARDSLRQPNV